MAIGPVVQVATAEIEVGAFEVRARDEDGGLAELAASIEADGLLVPVLVRRGEGGYELVAGHRRMAALRMLGRDVVEVRVVEGDEGACERLSIAENEFRLDVSPVERAWQIKRAYESGSMGLGELAKAYGRTESWVAGELDILGWPDRIQAAVHARRLGVGVGRQLAKVDDEAYREVLITAALENGCTVRTAAGWVAGYRAMQPAVEVAESAAPYVGSGMPPVVPTAVCPGCRESFRSDAMVAVVLCMGCRGALAGG